MNDMEKNADMAQNIMMYSLMKCLREEWYRINPYNDPEKYSADWQRFCEDKFNKILRG